MRERFPGWGQKESPRLKSKLFDTPTESGGTGGTGKMNRLKQSSGAASGAMLSVSMGLGQ